MIASLVNNPTIYETATCGHDEDAGWILAIELSFNTFMRLQLMPFMKCWWILEQRDVFVLISGREMRHM